MPAITPTIGMQQTSGPSKTADVANQAEAKTAKAGEVLGAPKGGKVSGAITTGIDQYNRIEPLQNDFLTAFPTAITAVEGLLKLGGLIAEVHPIAQVIVGVLKGAWTIIQANMQVNDHMHTLLSCMKELCVLTKQYATAKEHDALVCNIVKDISFAVMSGATLIGGYAEHQKHKSFLQLPTFFTSFEQDADQIAQTLTSLTTKLTGASVASVFSQVHQISSALHVVGAGVEQLVKIKILSTLPYAVDATVTLHDGNKHGCLPGTRAAVLEALQTWAAGGPASVTLNAISNPPTEQKLDLANIKVLWLQGVAGSGKSSIAASVAKFFENTNILMAYYHFDATKQQQLKPSNLFTTIALQLAAQDAALEAKLLELVTSATPLERRSQDPAEQLRLFLIPLLQQNTKGYCHAIIIIDALDESGGVGERSNILKPLAGLAALLPPTVHFLLTSRPELDIQSILGASPQPPHFGQLSMHDLPSHTTKNDIYLYVKHMLGGSHLNNQLDQLAELSEKAQLSFQWASTACCYIVDQEDGNQAVRPSKRLKNVLSGSRTADSQLSLYQLYTTVMDAQFGNSEPEDLELLKLLLGVLVAARRPLSLDAILQLLHMHLSQYGDTVIIKEDAAAYMGLLSSLIMGTRPAVNYTPLVPLHASFLDFLQDAHSSYYVDVGQIHKILTASCFSVMCHGERRLKFNICNLRTSFLLNSSVQGINGIVQENIGETLSYASHFWSSHLALAPDCSTSTLGSVKNLLSSAQFLHWLEVMSLTGASALESLAMVPILPGSGIATYVTEAVRFTSYYAIPIAQSAPHIYLSALPFTPTSSSLHLLGEQFLKIPAVKSGHMVLWPMLRHTLHHDSQILTLDISRDNVIAAGLHNCSLILWHGNTGESHRQQLTGHSGDVRSVAFSPDGTVLASGSSDRTIRLWDLQTKAVKGEPLMGHADYVTSVAFSPDGVVLASGSSDQTIRLWDVQTQAAKGEPLTGHTAGVISVAFSPDGAFVASTSQDRTIRLWDVQTQAAKGQPLVGHTDLVRSVVFSPDGAVIASGSYDQTVRLWDVQTQAARGDPLRGHTDYVTSVAFSPDGAVLASGSHDQTVRLWSVQTQAAKGAPLTGHTKCVTSVAFSPDGAVLASGSHDQTVRLWGVQTQAAKGAPLTGHTKCVTSVAFSRDGAALASGSYDQTIRMWNVQIETVKGKSPTGHTDSVTATAFSPSGATLASGSNDQTIRLWDVQRQQCKGEPLIGHTDWVQSVAFAPDGAVLASCSEDTTIRLWDVQNQVAKGQPLTGHTDYVTSVAFSPDGSVLASGSFDRTIRLWNVLTQQSNGEPLTDHTSYVRTVAFSPDGAVLASGSSDHTIRLWDVKTQQSKGKPLRGHTGYVTSVAFAPDGVILASGSSDQTIRLWDVQTQQPKGKPLTGHVHYVTAVAFSPDGATLASGCGDRTIQLWDVETQAAKGAPLTGHSRYVTSVAFSPDGGALISGSEDHTVCIWNTASQSLNFILPCLPQASHLQHGPAWCTFLDNGWLQGLNGELVLWIPPSYQDNLYDERLTAKLGHDLSSRVRLNFDTIPMGESWADCYTP
ncbi:WD40 repeat-like protein [Clavulina sp. PMI_390]|nr:WD40 repeat-like protein [Clavulina sp. PMI_390]